MTWRTLNRRAFLRGAGVAVALPCLEATSNPSHPQGVATAPKRMVCIGLFFGMRPQWFFPKGTGSDYAMPSMLRSLERHRRKLTFFSQLDHAVKGGHRASHSFLSGVLSKHAAGRPDANVTVDQKAAELVRGATRYPSFCVGTEDAPGDRLSWTRRGVALPATTDPRVLFDAMFRCPDPQRLQRQRDVNGLKRSVLDVLSDDARGLRRRLGKADHEKLDEFFTSIRSVERRIEQSDRWLARPKPTATRRISAEMLTSYAQRVPLLYDLIALAIETDATRVVTFNIAQFMRSSGLPRVNQGYHTLTHHGGDPSRLRQLKRVETFQAAQFARFLDRLEEKSLLDSTMVLFGSGLGDANSHSNRNLPLLLAGGGFRHGEHRAYSEDRGRRTPACNLFVSMLQQFGLEVDEFGTSTGTLRGLEPL